MNMDGTKVRYISFNALTLSSEDNQARLKWGIRMGFPRITVEPERIQEGDKYAEKVITAPFNVITFVAMLDMFERVIDSEPGTIYSVECKNIKYVNGERTSETYVQAKVIVGKDKEGIIFISVIADDKKKVKFSILPDSRWYTFYKNGTEITDRVELSHAFAKSYLKAIRSTYDAERLQENIHISITNRPANGSNFGKPFIKKEKPEVMENKIEESKVEEKPKEEKIMGSDTLDDILF